MPDPKDRMYLVLARNDLPPDVVRHLAALLKTAAAPKPPTKPAGRRKRPTPEREHGSD